MTRYRLTFSLPGIEDSPTMNVTVEAADENAAMDSGFDEAFRQFPQYGGFRLSDIEEVK